MDQSQHLRQVCADTIRRLAQAEQQAKHTRETANQQRQTALERARQQHTQARQQADTLLNRILTLAQQGDQVLNTLGLAPGATGRVALPAPTVGPDALLRLLATQSSAAETALTSLQTTASALVVERKKWWKFW